MTLVGSSSSVTLELHLDSHSPLLWLKGGKSKRQARQSAPTLAPLSEQKLQLLTGISVPPPENSHKLPPSAEGYPLVGTLASTYQLETYTRNVLEDGIFLIFLLRHLSKLQADEHCLVKHFDTYWSFCFSCLRCSLQHLGDILTNYNK